MRGFPLLLLARGLVCKRAGCAVPWDPSPIRDLGSNDNNDPRWRLAVQILSIVLMVDWVLLGSGESNKG